MEKTAAVAIIGNEILSGETQDTNSGWLAKELYELGITLRLIIVLPDEEDTIVNSLRPITKEYDYVFVCGGIGPTPDDLTRQSIARLVGRPLEMHSQAREELIKFYTLKNLTDARLQMAMLPKGARLIMNEATGAPGFWIENVLVFPGIPKLLQDMFPAIREEIRSEPIYTERFHTSLGESQFAAVMQKAGEMFPKVSIGSYPRLDRNPYSAKLIFKSRSKDDAQGAKEWMMKEVRRLEAELGKPVLDF